METDYFKLIGDKVSQVKRLFEEGNFSGAELQAKVLLVHASKLIEAIQDYRLNIPPEMDR